jgi:type II secretory pathway pseudopilin PulG
MLSYEKSRGFLFSLLEMTVAFAVFLILITIILRLYSAAFSVTVKASNQSLIFENARIAMDIIARDLQSIYYRNEATPFWHWKPDSKPASWGDYRNELLAFISATSLSPNDNCVSSLSEIKYQLYYSTNKTKSNNGWLRRSVTGDHTSTAANGKWNFYYNLNTGYGTDLESEVTSAFTANSSSSENYQKVIPYVTELSFICYDREGNSIEPDRNTDKSDNFGSITGFPYSVDVTLRLMDKDSWQKWLNLFSDNDYPDNEPISAILFRQQNEREFRKTVFIGERG